MNNRMVRELVSLEAKLDRVLFAEPEMEPQKKKRGMGGVIAGTAAVGVGAGAAGLRKRYGADQVQGARNQVRTTVSGAKREVGEMIERVPGAMKTAKLNYKARRVLNKQPVAGAAWGAVKRGARKVMGFASEDSQIQELGAKLDAVLEFAEDQNRVSRVILGGPITSAISAPKGKKMKAFKEQYKHSLKETGKGAKSGAKKGALIGAGAGAALALGGKKGANILTKKMGRKLTAARTAKGALIGAGAAGYGGALIGGAKGGYGSNEIHQRAKRGEV